MLRVAVGQPLEIKDKLCTSQNQHQDFFDDPKNYKNAPADLVEISDEVYKTVCSNPPKNKILSADENGYPILVDPAPSESDIARQQNRRN